MSRGFGVIQLRLVAAFQAEPGKPFAVRELASVVFPGMAIERKHEVSVRRALKNLPNLQLQVIRAGTPRAHGWRLFVALAE